MSLDIRPTLVLSTGHVDPETRDWLNAQGELIGTYHRDRANPAIHLAPHIYGWLLYAHEDADEWSLDVPPGVVEVLKPIFAFALENKCSWIMLDCDADPVEGLKTWDW